MNSSGKKARIWEEALKIPTYEMGEEERLPIFHKLRINQGTKGDIYPYKTNDKLKMELNPDHVYRAIRMENDYIRVTVLPELGGRIYEGYDKVNDYNFVYKNNVIKPALIGLNGAWSSGGIEFNWPQHHRPTTFLPMEATIEKEPDGTVTAWMGETEAMNGMKSLLGVSIGPDTSFITAKVKLYNPTPQRHVFHWWANLAVHVNDRYRLMFPPDIDYVTFHDKTHVSPFPVVKGEFAGADFNEGVDIRYVKNIRSCSSFFIFDSAYSFMAGYDDGKNMGTVHVADRFLSPGKKFFTWGRSGYGDAWQKNLTDADGDYIEIMTGCFTDNQPDFTWMAPYETKTFEQRWYSLCGLRELKNATNDGAISVDSENGRLAVQFNVTKQGPVNLWVNGEQTAFEAVPGRVYEWISAENLKPEQADVRLTGENGEELVAWKNPAMFFDGKEVPEPRKKPLPPEEIGSVEELWVTGMHIEQYKHAVMKPDPYYLEGLRRDPGHMRLGMAMGVLLYRRGRYQEALSHLETAVRRAALHNPNPYDAECYYQLGLVQRCLGQPDAALKSFKRAAWSYGWKSAALLQSAELETASGDFRTALCDLEDSLETNRHSLRALTLRAALLLRLGRSQEAGETAEYARRWDRLDAGFYFIDVLRGDKQAEQALCGILGEKTGAYIDLAETFLSAGLAPEGIRALSLCKNPSALTGFYMAYAYHQMGDRENGTRWLREAENLPLDRVFPNRPFDFTVLELGAADGSAVAAYYLGCMYYARDTEGTAAAYFQQAVERNPDFADARRMLAQALFETYGDTGAALRELQKAFSLNPEPRLLYELFQLRKVSGVPQKEQLQLLEQHMDLTQKKQELLTAYVELLLTANRLEEAKRILDTGEFYTYEGGEGATPRLYACTCILLGQKALAMDENDRALALFKEADTYPERFHEGRRHQQRDAHRHYFIARGHEAVGDRSAYLGELETAAASTTIWGNPSTLRAWPCGSWDGPWKRRRFSDI